MREILKDNFPTDIPDFWTTRLRMNAEEAIYYQWEQLEKTRCIDNFRIAAGLKEGFREGYFFADSDAYKWLDAASRILAHKPSPRLSTIVDRFIDILGKAQCEDGYLFTYNQIHFGGSRWQNLQIEHEMYCMGHLIEAGVSHYAATGSEKLLSIVRRLADLLVDQFMEAAPILTDGHEEIEIALIRLGRITGVSRYTELAKRLLERRGRTPLYGWHFLVQTWRSAARMRKVGDLRKNYYKLHPQTESFSLPGHNQHSTPVLMPLRFAVNAFNGKFVQQHRPLIRQNKPVGHAVRFSYLQTAAAMLVRDTQANADLDRLGKLWQRMVSRRMFVTGGIGALPLIEGFGRDYELDPQIAYAETCAALGSMLWAHELNLATGKPCFADLYEWQLYNAASVGIGLDGRSYFYNNPLVSKGGMERKGWYHVPCCPSNLSRVWASLQNDAVLQKEGITIINQYVSGEYKISPEVLFTMNSLLPWVGKVTLRFALAVPAEIDLVVRIPAWAGGFRISYNGMNTESDQAPQEIIHLESAVDLHFEASRYIHVHRKFRDQDELVLHLDMPLCLRKQDSRVKGCGGMWALTRGPLVYCLETIDNSEDIFEVMMDPESFETRIDPSFAGGIVTLTGRSSSGKQYTWIPYMLWGNRGKSAMNVFFKTSG